MFKTKWRNSGKSVDFSKKPTFVQFGSKLSAKNQHLNNCVKQNTTANEKNIHKFALFKNFFYSKE